MQMQQRFYGFLRENIFFGITALNPVAFLTNTIGIADGQVNLRRCFSDISVSNSPTQISAISLIG